MKHKLPTLILFTLSLHLSVRAQQMNPATNEFLVNQQISGTQTYPHVASDENGGYVIVWRHTANTLMARRYGPDHQPITDEIVVAQGNLARVYYWSEGRYVIAWSGSPAGMKVLNADNTLSETYAVGYADGVDMDIRGDELVQVSTASQHIHIRKWNLLTHAWTGPSVQVSEAPNANYRYPQVRWTNTGQIVTVYSRGSGTNRIYRKTFNSNLLAQIPEEIVHTLNFGLVNVINVSINALDQLLIYAKFGVNGTDVFWGRVLGPDGSELTAGVGNMSAPYAQYYSDCELFDNGAVVLTNNYMTSLNDPEDYNVRVNYGIDLGSPNTGWQPASNTVSGEQRYPHVTKLPNGGFLMVWNGNGFQGDADGVYARAFGAAGFPGLATNSTLPLVVNETGTTRVLGLRLGIAPTSNVVVDLTVSDPAEASISMAQLTFTPTNWNTVQNITVTGLDDAVDDGDANLHVNATFTSADVAYANLASQQFAVVNRDDDATIFMPADLSICRADGAAAIAVAATNNGEPLNAPTVVSSNQAVVPNAAISVTTASPGNFHINVASLPNATQGSTTLTFNVSDGTFTYSGTFELTLMGVTPVIDWVNMELASTSASSYQWYLNGVALVGANAQVFEPEVNGDYTVETTDANGCVELSASYYFGTSGVSDHATAQGICAYPVPTQGLLNIVGAKAGAALLVYDMSGRQVANSTANAERTTFDLSHIAPGNYVLRVIGKQGTHIPVIIE